MFRKIRRWWNDNALMFFAQGFLGVIRFFLRTEELTAPPARREKLRRFREKMAEVDQERDEVVSGLDDLSSDDRSKREAAFDRFEKFRNKHHGDRDDSEWQEMRAMQAESDALQAIRRSADDNTEAAIAGFQSYIAEHPESHSAYSYLGGALTNAKKFGAAIEAYRAAERIALEKDTTDLRRTYLARHSIGSAQLLSGDPPAAIATWNQLVADISEGKDFHKAIAYLSIGDAYRQTGDIAAARKAWKQVAQFDETGIMAAEAKKRLAEFR